MFKLAILIGLYGYFIFLLGISHHLKKELIAATTIIFFLVIIKTHFKKILIYFDKRKILFRIKDKFLIFLIFLILFQVLVNLIGVLGPELAFDALWYHLTIPKIYLQHNSIFYIGGHLYYSAMPQLTEMLYLTSLVLGNEIFAKMIHFLFGILSLLALFRLSRMFLSIKQSLLVCVIFYSNLVVGWLSITSYIDLARTFYETMALWGFLIFLKYQKLRWLILSAIMVGFASSTKLLSLWSVGIYIALIFFIFLKKEIKVEKAVKLAILFCGIVCIIVSPWIIFSLLNTGYPFFPLFSPMQGILSETVPFETGNIFKVPLYTFLSSPDPVSPIYFISLPLILFYFLGFNYKKDTRFTNFINILLIYLMIGFVSLYFAPLASSGRFITPYLPAFSLLCVFLFVQLKEKFLYKFLILVVILISLSSISYRGLANKRFIPVIFGNGNVQTFMDSNLEYQVGNFYDVDNFFKDNIKPSSTVLIYGISNLFYINFPYIHESWVKKGDKFDYILLKASPLPERFKNWKLVYKNKKTKVSLYHNSSNYKTEY